MEPEKVFVSSTCHDLIDLRAELREHIRDMGLVPILSDADDFKVEPDVNSIETCLVNLRASDIVLTIVAGRYGPTLGGKYGDVSATHLEYKTAVEARLPRHFFVRDTTLGAFQAWRTASDKTGKFRPVEEKDGKYLFPWLEEQGKLDGAVGSNWLHSFTSSVDLRRRVSKQLEREAERAFITRGMAEGRIPVLALWVERGVGVRRLSKQGERLPTNLSINVKIKNPSTAPVFDVTVSESPVGYGVIDPMQEKEFMISRTLDGSAIFVSFRVEYDTIFGERVAIDVDCSADHPPRVLSRRIHLVSVSRFEIGALRPQISSDPRK